MVTGAVAKGGIYVLPLGGMNVELEVVQLLLGVHMFIEIEGMDGKAMSKSILEIGISKSGMGFCLLKEFGGRSERGNTVHSKGTESLSEANSLFLVAYATESEG